MTELTTAAHMGRVAGIAYRETARVMAMIDWAEVGTIVLHGLVAAVVLTYYGGLLTGRWVYRANDQLARAWVRLWVPEATGKDCLQVADHVLTTGPVVEHETAAGESQAPTVKPAPIATGRVVTAELARQMMAEGMSQRAVSRELAIPRTTLRRMLAKA
jgi:hypothetical protein